MVSALAVHAANRPVIIFRVIGIIHYCRVFVLAYIGYNLYIIILW